MIDGAVFEFLKNLGLKYNAEKVILYGSRARGDNHETSDYDVAFFGITNRNYQAEIWYACEWEAPTLKNIDTLFDNRADEKILNRIEKEGTVLYEREKSYKT